MNGVCYSTREEQRSSWWAEWDGQKQVAGGPDGLRWGAGNYVVKLIREKPKNSLKNIQLNLNFEWTQKTDS